MISSFYPSKREQPPHWVGAGEAMKRLSEDVSPSRLAMPQSTELWRSSSCGASLKRWCWPCDRCWLSPLARSLGLDQQEHAKREQERSKLLDGWGVHREKCSKRLRGQHPIVAEEECQRATEPGELSGEHA